MALSTDTASHLFVRTIRYGDSTYSAQVFQPNSDGSRRVLYAEQGFDSELSAIRWGLKNGADRLAA